MTRMQRISVVGPSGAGKSTLARALADGRGPEGYDVDFQRAHGGLLASSDLFRRFSQTLAAGEMAQLIRAGVLSPELMKHSMAHRPVRPPVGPLAKAALNLMKTPSLAQRLLPVLARMRLIERHWSNYPSDPSERERWERHVSRLTS